MAFAKLAGKRGRVNWFIGGNTNTNNFLSMKTWKLTLDADMIDSDTFEKSVNSGDGQFYHEYMTGLIGGIAGIDGMWDNTLDKMPSGPTLGIQPGAEVGTGSLDDESDSAATVFLCFDTVSGVGYTLTGKVKTIRAGADVAKDCNFGFDLQVESVAYTSQT